LDEFIERTYGPITELFAQHGEWGFRLRERAALRLLTNEFRRGVVAVGGGTPCFFDNAAFMNALGTTVWLKTSPEKAASRIAGKDRPLFKNVADPIDHMKRLLAQRESYYRLAQLILDNDLDNDHDEHQSILGLPT
jgi:shikimate kinase